MTEEAAETIDATGQIVCRDSSTPTPTTTPSLLGSHSTPSNLFGVTSMVAGNCGFSLAPFGDAADGEYLKHMMTKVEGMALEALEQGVPWNWLSFAEYLDRVEESGTAINVAFMVGHSAIRRMVLKEDSVGKEATPEQLAEMRALLKTSIEAGEPVSRLGVRSPTPTSTASRYRAAGPRGRGPGTVRGDLAARGDPRMGRRRALNGFDDDEVELMTKMSVLRTGPSTGTSSPSTRRVPRPIATSSRHARRPAGRVPRSWRSRCPSSSA